MGQPTAKWKQGGARIEATSDSASRRWGVTLLAVLLLVFLGWILWSLYKPSAKAGFLALAPREFDKLELPLQFVDEDLAWLADVNANASPVHRNERPRFGAADIAAQLKELKLTEADTLFVYVIAQGVSAPGESGAYFAASGGKKVPVRDLLTAVSSSRAKTKLIVLDCQRTRVDASRGLYPNAFLQELAADMRDTPAKNVFVLTACSEGEATAVLPDKSRTLFGLAFESAVRSFGSGTSDPTVGGLVSAIREEMAKFLEPAQISQTPVLFELGQSGVSRERLQTRLTAVRFTPPPPPPAEEASGGTKEEKKGEKESETAEKKAGSKKDAPSGDSKTPKKADDVYAQIDEAWTLRDALQGPANPHWPSVFAPHLWQEVQATLIDEELRLRSGEALRGEARGEVRRMVRELDELHQGVREARRIDEGLTQTAVGRLKQAWNAYLREGTAFRRWNQPASSSEEQIDTRVFHAYLAAVQDLPWVLQLSDQLSSVGRLPQDEVEFVRQVRTLLASLQAFQDQVLTRKGNRRLSDRALLELETALNDARERLRQPIRQMAGQITREAERRPVNLKDQHAMQIVLRSPLWTLADRQAWRGVLQLPTDFVEKASASQSGPKVERRIPVEAYKELLSHLSDWLPKDVQDEIPARLIALHDARLRPLQSVSKEHSFKGWQVNQLLALVDPRDSRLYPYRADGVLEITLPPRENWEFKWSQKPVDVPLTPAVATVSIEVRRLSGVPRDQVEATLSFEDPLVVTRNNQPVAPGEPLTVAITDGRGILDLQVQARSFKLDGSASGSLRVSVADKEEVLRDEMAECRLPTERKIELIATSTVIPGERSAVSGGILSLPLYPNRQTPWEFQLRNRSADPRTVSVRFLPLPEAAVEHRPGELNLAIAKRLQQDGFPLNRSGESRLLYEAATLTLQPNEAKLIVAPPPMPKEGSPAAAPPPAPGTDPPRGPDVSPGMICIVQEVESTASSADLYWIGWDWIRPHQYLTASATFDSTRTGSSFQMRFNGGGTYPLPPGLDENPIRIRGRLDATRDDVGQVPTGLEASLGAESPTADAFIDLPSGSVTRRVVVDVDGWPRAFAFDVDCSRVANETIVVDSRRIRLSARIVSVQVDNQPVAFHPDSGPEFKRSLIDLEPAEPPKAGAPPGKKLIQLSQGLPAAYQPGKTLVVTMEVDLPEARQPNERVVLSAQAETGQSTRRTFRTDRTYKCELLEFKSGAARFGTSVKDLTAEFNVSGRDNVRDDLQLVFEGAARNTESICNVGLIFDSQKPEIQDARSRGSSRTLDLTVEVDVDDSRTGSGADVVRVALVDDDGRVGEKRFEPAELDRSSGKWVTVFPTKKLDRDKRWFVFVEATDRAGNTSKFGPKSVTLPLPPAVAAPSEPKKPEKGTIVGKVVKGPAKFPIKGATVTLKGTNVPPQKAGSDGRFEFKDLKLQAYTLEVRGLFNGSPVKADVGGVEPTPDGEKPQEITVPVE